MFWDTHKGITFFEDQRTQAQEAQCTQAQQFTQIISMHLQRRFFKTRKNKEEIKAYYPV